MGGGSAIPPDPSFDSLSSVSLDVTSALAAEEGKKHSLTCSSLEGCSKIKNARSGLKHQRGRNPSLNMTEIL